MNRRRIGMMTAAAGLSALLCAATATPAQAGTPSSWESQALDLSSAQRTAQGEGVTVAILDGGVVEDHPDLAGKVTTGRSFVDSGLKPGDPEWGAHGTAMASDVLKVAPKADILSVEVLASGKKRGGGGKEKGGAGGKKRGGGKKKGPDPIVQGVDYAVRHGADVISMSLGRAAKDSRPDDMTKALAHAAYKGVPVVASAGNYGNKSNRVNYPSAHPGVISVAGAGRDGRRAEFSNVRTYTTLTAPGVGIISAKNTGGYKPENGTSPAAALTSGVVALLLGEDSELRPSQVRTLLTKTAEHPPGGHNPLVGHGMINAAAAVRAVSDPPPDTAAPVDYKGTSHLASRFGGMESMALPVGVSAAGVGLLMLAGAVLIGRRGRRRAATTALPGAVGFPGAPR